MRRPIIFILLAGLGAILAAIVVFSALRNRESEVQRAMAHTVEVVVAARDIPLGEKVQPDAVKLVRWARDGVPQGSFTDPNAVVGSFAKNQFVANEPVVVSKLFMGEKTSGVMPLLIPAGMRAMSVPVDEVADIAGFVAPHTHVDILAAVSGTGPGESTFSRIVLQNIEVLAVAQEIEHVKDEPQVVKVVTLLVTPSDAEKLTLASREGTLRLAMRNYSDSKIIPTNGIALNDLMHNGGATMPVMQPQPLTAARPAHLNADGRTPLRVEVMRAGKSSEAISFLNSGRTRRSTDQPRDDTPAVSPPPPPAPAAEHAPNSLETPLGAAAAGSAASFTAAPSYDSSLNPSSNTFPLKPRQPGYPTSPKHHQ